jgi:hypothetical protein
VLIFENNKRDILFVRLLFKFMRSQQDNKVCCFGGFLNLTVINKAIKYGVFLYLHTNNLDSSVSIVTRPWAAIVRDCNSILLGANRVFVSLKYPDQQWGPPRPLMTGYMSVIL